ncbi:MAG: choloylglycine hydrolase family protein [Ruminococcaceae bacterium]|nr:choloylglycine hydrolase family protein [Oscillospiraceae bacterium]
MCTAISVNKNGYYFGRNLDVFASYGEKVIITPENYEFRFSDGLILKNHYAIIGMAIDCGGVPLYFDGTNSCGLSMAGLKFPEKCVYNPPVEGKLNVASYELISRVLSMCRNIGEVKKFVSDMNITKTAFSKELTPTPLHWIVSDKSEALTIEQTADGLKVYDNPFGILTNSPEFTFHKENVRNFLHLSNANPQSSFCDDTKLNYISNGMGTMGLPGDFSSPSRFVRAFYVKETSLFEGEESDRVSQFFHILYSVYHTKGCVKSDEGYEYTRYSSCTDCDNLIYYYTTYSDLSMKAVDMKKANLSSDKLISGEKV